MSSVYAGQSVIDRLLALQKKGAKFPGLCLKLTRTGLNIPAKYPSAKAAWLATPPANRHAGVAPKGFPMFYQISPTSKYWHVVTSNGDGDVISNITAEGGIIKKVKYKLFARYLGWADVLNGVRILEPPAPAQPEHAKPTPVTKPPAWRGARYPGKVLKIGVSGDAVKELQFHLGLKITGRYTKTEANAVNNFVIARNKKYPKGKPGYLGRADGTAGPKTYKAITGHA